MKIKNASDYLKAQILNHIRNFFTEETSYIVEKVGIFFLPLNQIKKLNSPSLNIPNDIPGTSIPENNYKVSFNGTELTIWNSIQKPDSSWKALPDESYPLLYYNKYGVTIPAWDIFSTLFNLLNLKEETDLGLCDKNGRFLAKMSPRYKLNLLEVPIFNEAVALLVAICINLFKTDTPDIILDKQYIAPPYIILSHDNDILYGNDCLTQAIRLYRIFIPLKKLKLPKFSNLYWIIKNFFNPKEYYLDNILGMCELEKMFSASSSYYFLNGTGGRYGFRGKEAHILEAKKIIPETFNIGIHYNYDTFLNEEKFQKQFFRLSLLLNMELKTGRAHYLKFSPDKSFEFLSRIGIKCDETLGYPDLIGYRCGIAGPFQPYDFQNQKAYNYWEFPLVIMDKPFFEQYPQEHLKRFEQMLLHLTKIGGAITILFHPGIFYNREFPEFIGLYHNLLKIAKQFHAIGTSAAAFLNLN